MRDYRTLPVDEIVDRNRERNAGKSNAHGSLDDTVMAMAVISKAEGAWRQRQTQITTQINRSLVQCTDDSIASTIESVQGPLETQLRAVSHPEAPVRIPDQSFDSRIQVASHIVARDYRPNQTIPLLGDKFDEVAKLSNTSTAINPQAVRAKGILGELVEVGRYFNQKGQTAQANASYEMARSLTEISLGLTPGVGLGKDIYEAVSGHALLDGRELSFTERGFAVFGIVTAGYGDQIAEALSNLLTKVAGSAAAQAIFRHLDNIQGIIFQGQVRGLYSAGNLPTGRNLSKYLLTREYSAVFDDLGRLRPEAAAFLEPTSKGIKSSRWAEILVQDGSKLDDWGYYKISLKSSGGQIDGRIYFNAKTGASRVVKTQIGLMDP